MLRKSLFRYKRRVTFRRSDLSTRALKGLIRPLKPKEAKEAEEATEANGEITKGSLS